MLCAATLVGTAVLLCAAGGTARAPVEGRTSAAAGAASLRPAVREPPHWPESYSVNYTFTLPYTARIQQPPLSYPVAFYRDAREKRVRMDTYDSTQVLIAKKGKILEVVPRVDRLVCLVLDDDGEEAGMSALPDVQGWQYCGTQQFNGEEADVWQYEARHEAKHVVYTFYAAATDSTPRRLHMHGNDLVSGAHFDEWVVDYTSFSAGRPNPELFATPALCDKGEAQELHNRGRRGALLRWAAMVPSVRYRGDSQYDVFLAGHGAGRTHRSLADYQQRREIFHSNQQLIEDHNAAPGTSYEMAMNRFGDYSEEEFVALMLPKQAHRQQQQQQQQGLRLLSSSNSGADLPGAELEWELKAGEVEKAHLAKHELPYEPLADSARLPASLSWRGTRAGGVGVKDQATCGSCWSFAATGTMEGAWWRATGQSVSFSEQQILDCSWGYHPKVPEANLACDGGDPDAGIGYVVEAGGIAENQDYPYKGQDGYCLANQTRLLGKFKGFVRVPRYDDAALREALYSRGPIAISFDASRPSFRFFSSGVYVDTECKWKPGQLDHSMLLVGYGTNEAGDYWEVRNSWSTHWGEGGYFKVSRDVNHACGVPSDATYALVADGV